MSTTLDQLEHKLNVTQMVKENPWPAIGLAMAAGFILSGSRADVRAAAATVAATRGASGRLGPVLDDLVSQVVSNVSTAFENRVTSWVDEIRDAIGTGGQQQSGQRPSGQQQGGARFADMPNTNASSEFGSGYAAGGGRVGTQGQGMVSQAGSAGIGGTPSGTGGATTGGTGFGTGPSHTTPSSFGNAAEGTSPSVPGTRAD
ncbi:MAG TPA: hypothetical protein VEA99_01655 [Gemmatimonadaceae bacterium]|nr:hypothetical protein [Gemmatimonadaceae bacterium]